MKYYLGECSSKVTRPNGERSKILVANPEIVRTSGKILAFLALLSNNAVRWRDDV